MLRTSRLGLGAAVAALVCSIASTVCAQTQPSGAARPPLGSKTRFACIDSEYIAGKGVGLRVDKVRANGARAYSEEVEADLAAFSSGLDVKLIDAAMMSGAMLIADKRLDVSDAVISAHKAKPNPAAPLNVPAITIPDAYVAFINSDEFADPRKGIKPLADAFKAIEKEFSRGREEVRRLTEEAATASGERRRELASEVKRRQEEGQAALEKRVNELTAPIYQDITRALISFCKQHGISLVFNLSNIGRTDKLPPYDLALPADTPDVTEAFAKAYNKGLLRP